MRKTKRAKLAERMKEDSRTELAKAYRVRFKHDVETVFDICAGTFGGIVTRRVDRENFTEEQRAFVAAWCGGFGCAVAMVEASE